MFTFIMRYCLIESNDDNYYLIVPFFKGRFKLIKLGDDDRNSSSAITDKAYSSPDSDPDARGSGISGLNDSYFALIDPYLCNLKLNLWQLLNHQ